jgi:hypothetical protein
MSTTPSPLPDIDPSDSPLTDIPTELPPDGPEIGPPSGDQGPEPNVELPEIDEPEPAEPPDIID